MTIPGQFPTIPDHNTVRPADNHSCEKTYINAFALFVPTSSAELCIAFKAILMLCSHLHEQSGRALIRDPLTAVGMLVLFATVEKIPEAIKAGRSIKVQKGNFCAEIEASD